jgi:hypothetical protein
MPLELAPRAAAGFDVLSMANNYAFDAPRGGRDATRGQLTYSIVTVSRGDIARLVVKDRASLIALQLRSPYDLNDPPTLPGSSPKKPPVDILIVRPRGGGPDRAAVRSRALLGRNWATSASLLRGRRRR